MTRNSIINFIMISNIFTFILFLNCSLIYLVRKESQLHFALMWEPLFVTRGRVGMEWMRILVEWSSQKEQSVRVERDTHLLCEYIFAPRISRLFQLLCNWIYTIFPSCRLCRNLQSRAVVSILGVLRIASRDIK